MNFSKISSRIFGLQQTEDTKPFSPTTQAAPQAFNPKQQEADRRMFFSAKSGGAMRNRLTNALQGMRSSSPSRPGGGKVDLHANAHMFAANEAFAADIVQTSNFKLERDRHAIGGTLDGWASGRSASLKSELKKFIAAGSSKTRADGPANDSMRAAMTALSTISMSMDPDRTSLKLRAQSMGEAVIFNAVSYEGGKRIVTPFNVRQFASQDSLGKIDGLNIPVEERGEIADRVKTALNDVIALNRAFIRNEQFAPEASFDPGAVISVLVEDEKVQSPGAQQHSAHGANVGASHARYPTSNVYQPQAYGNASRTSFPPPPAYSSSSQGAPPGYTQRASQGSVGTAPNYAAGPALKRSNAVRRGAQDDIAQLMQSLNNATNSRDEARAYNALRDRSAGNPGLRAFLDSYDPMGARTAGPPASE